MERRLIEAASKGDVEELHSLIKEHPLVLSIVALGDGNSPLHIACMGSHLDFVKEVLILVPELAPEINPDGLSPLHIASARGDVEIVKELLKVGHHLCLAKGKERRIPLHSAVAKGRIGAITELLSASSDSITQVTARGETCFHLAVKYNQCEAFKFLHEHVVAFNKPGILNYKDHRGNTLLHLAASRKQYEVFDLLLGKSSCFKSILDVKALNKKRLTPYDVLTSEGGDGDIEETLTLAGATTIEITSPPTTNSHSQDPNQEEEGRSNHTSRPKSASQKLQDYFKYDKINESPSRARNTLLVITVLIATATYQSVLSPPGGVWQEDYWPNGGDAGKNSSRGHKAGQSVMGTNNHVGYGLFLLFNSIGFFMSLHMMNFLTLGLPLQFELRVALTALIATYDTCMVAITPAGTLSTCFIVFSSVMPVIMNILTKVVRDFRKGESRCTSLTA